MEIIEGLLTLSCTAALKHVDKPLPLLGRMHQTMMLAPGSD